MPYGKRTPVYDPSWKTIQSVKQHKIKVTLHKILL